MGGERMSRGGAWWWAGRLGLGAALSSVGLGCPSFDPPRLPNVAETEGTTEPGTTGGGTSPPAATTGEPADTTAGVATGPPDATTDGPRTTTDAPGTTTDEPETTTNEPETTTNEPGTTTDEPQDCMACVESQCPGELEQCMEEPACACFQECAAMNPGIAGAFSCANDCGVPFNELMNEDTVAGMFVICVQNNCPQCVE